MPNTTTSVNLTGVTGNVYATSGFTTIYSNVPQANAINFLVNANASIQATNPTYTTDTVTGFHALETIQVQGSYTSFTAWSYYGQVMLTNASTGQSTQFQLTQPTGAGGGNNSGVNVQFLDGSLAFTSNVSGSGAWTVWMTMGGSGTAGTTGWGTNSVIIPFTAATAVNLTTLGASGSNTINTAINSSTVTNWTSSTGTAYVLTTGIDTIPTSGTMPAGSTVTGTNTASPGTSTFNTGDTINGTAGTTSTLTITETSGPSGSIAATLNNVSNIAHQMLSASTATYSEALYTGLTSEMITKGAGGGLVVLTGASTATTFGVSSGTTDGMIVTFGSGTSNATWKLNLAGAGTASATSPISYATSAGTTLTDISAITITGSGTNNVLLSSTTNVSSVTITGSGVNTISLTGANAIKTSSVTIDATAATGNQIIDLGSNYAATDIIKGDTAAGITTTLGARVTGTLAAPTWTNVSTFQVDSGSTGNQFLTGVTSVTSIRQNDLTAADNTTLTNLGQLSSLVFVGTGTNASQTFGTITLSGSSLPGTADSVAVTFNNLGVALSSANALLIGGSALGLTGAETVSINTANAVGSSGATTLTGGLSDSNLKTFTLTSASSGTVTMNTVTGGTNALTTFDASGDAGALTITFSNNTLGNGSSIVGAVGVNNVTFGTDTTAVSVVGTFGSASNTFTASASQDLFTLTFGNGNNTISTGTGADSITVGSGTNSINASRGANTIALSTHAANTDTIVINVPLTSSSANGNTDTFSGVSGSGGFRAGASGDLIQLSAGSILNADGTNKFILESTGTATAAASGSSSTVTTWAGTAALAPVAGTSMIDLTSATTYTSSSLLSLLTTAGTSISVGTVNATAGQMLLVEYNNSDGTVHLAAVTLGAVTSTQGATAVTDVVLTGQTTHFTTANIAWIT